MKKIIDECFPEEESNDEKLSLLIKNRKYEYLLSIIDSDTSNKLKQIDEKIKLLNDKLKKETGWIATETGVYRIIDQTVFDNITYIIPRNPEYGYYVPGLQEDASSIQVQIEEVEDDFYLDHFSELNIIHGLFQIKEMILNEKLTIVNSNVTQDYLDYLLESLGYKKETQKLVKQKCNQK